MTELNDIADLIATMGKAEKRLFKMTASTEAESAEVLIQLFDQIDKETISIEKLEASKLYSPQECENLFLLILKSLRSYYAESKLDFYLKDEVINICCLFDKAQYKQCRKMLTSLKKQLYEIESFNYLLKVFDIEKKLIAFEEGKSIQLKPTTIATEEQSVINHEKRLVKYKKLFGQIKMAKASDQSYLENVLKDSLLVDYIGALGLKESVYVFKCKALAYYKLNKMQDAERETKNVNELLQKHRFLADHFEAIN